ncbi:MAG TPA: hypothetical protein PKC76_10245 [Saprospiraceae bacterium]|nr:hypothetical protein [Saprospiraceae bacterium]HMP24503.1 hypothetical protein [Saprospiraceae bacterium]
MEMKIFEEIEIKKIDTASISQEYLLMHGGAFFQISEMLANLINSIKKNNLNLETALIDFNKQNDRKLSRKNFEEIINQILLPILNSHDKNQSLNSFKFRNTIVAAHRLSPITRILKHLFNPYLIYVLVSISLLFSVVFLITDNTITTITSLQSSLFIGLLFFLSVIFHELGHASACKYYNIEHGDIGFAVYFYFPVFYADVSQAWTLERKQRLIIDFGGIYFQLVFLIPIFIISFITNSESINLLIYSILISFLFDINPFFKFDGYWFVSDLLGIPNLRQKTNEIPRFLIAKFLKKSQTKKPFLFSLREKEKYFFISYVILVNIFFVYIFFYRIPILLYSFFQTIPSQIAEIYALLSVNSMPLDKIMFLVIQIAMFLLIVFVIYNALKRLLGYKF